MDMVAVEGQFTFTAETPHLSCATFLMAEPSELISVEVDRVDIDCSGGDFITVRNPHAAVVCVFSFKADLVFPPLGLEMLPD